MTSHYGKFGNNTLSFDYVTELNIYPKYTLLCLAKYLCGLQRLSLVAITAIWLFKVNVCHCDFAPQ